jgi:hypothetical protein
MAALATTVDTLINWAKMRDPDMKAAMIVELLNQSNEIIPDMRWMEGNLPLGNRTTVRVSLPTVYTRQIGQAVATSTSRSQQFDDSCAIIEAWNEVDCKLADLEADSGQYRFQQMLPYFEAMSQKFAYLFWYGDTTQDPTQFFGMSARYATVNTATAASAQNVIDCGGTGSVNGSMWLITHGERATTGIFPKGSKAGLQHQNLGMIPSTVTAGYPSQRLMVYADQYTWDAGVAVKDWRWNVRACNIDMTNLTTESGAADLLKTMAKMLYRLPSIGIPASTTGNPMSTITLPGSLAFYCNRTMREMLHIQALNKTSNQLTIETMDGQKVLTFLGIPIRNSDQLLSTEARVV